MVETRILNSFLDRTRATRYLPGMKGLSALLKIYNAILPDPCVRQIADFDGDLSLEVSLRDCIGVNLWHAPEQYERRERELFCSATQPGSAVLDIGANIGLFTLLAAKRGASVISIEADPQNARQLRHHLSMNRLTSSVRVLEMAAAECDGEFSLYRNQTNSGGSSLVGDGNGVAVRGDSIDSLGLPPIDLCKIDIEGFEIHALRGMVETIERSPNLKLLIEYSEPHGKESAQEMLAFLRMRFERIEVVGGDCLGIFDEPPAYCNLWCTGSVRAI